MIKKALLAGIANLVLSFIWSFLLNTFIPGLAQEYQNGAIFRPWSDPLMMIYFLHPFILSFALVYLWGYLKKSLHGSVADRAWHFAKICFVVSTIPGMFITYTSFHLSFTMIASWTILGFLEAFTSGYVFARIKE